MFPPLPQEAPAFFARCRRATGPGGKILKKIWGRCQIPQPVETVHLFPIGNGPIVTGRCLRHKIVRTFQGILSAL